jgi:hypothetical protein
VEEEMNTCPSCGHTWINKRKPKEPKNTDPRISSLIQRYAAIFQYRYNHAPTIKFGATGSMLKALLKTMSEDQIDDCIVDYIAHEDEFYKKSGYSILLLPNFIQKQAVLGKKTKGVML